MLSFFNTLYKPEVFHGVNKKNNFFEGWFFKVIDESGNNVLAVIPGIFMNKDKEKEHSFIQILSGADHRSHYIRYDANEFVSERSKFSIKIDKEKCKGCKLCIIFCPKGIVKENKKLNKRGIHFAELKDPDMCTGCTSCAIICPECAIEISKND